ncbi:hypothetical protein HOE04_03120 [archaeon]|jgi:hypothetical protein|nr:hypothetical protein [archaeon]
MISWIVMLILVVIGIFAIKMNHLKHRLFIIMLVLVALFLYSSMALITTQNELSFDDSEGFFNAMKVYNGWLANGFSNLKAITGNAMKMDWSSTNETFFEGSGEG